MHYLIYAYVYMDVLCVCVCVCVGAGTFETNEDIHLYNDMTLVLQGQCDLWGHFLMFPLFKT